MLLYGCILLQVFYPPLRTSPFVIFMMEDLQRLLAKLLVRKAPVTPAMLDEMVRDTAKSHSLTDLRLVTACLLTYAGFLRFYELVSIRPCISRFRIS